MLLTNSELAGIAELHGGAEACGDCRVFASKGWESFPSTTSDKNLVLIGTMWNPEAEEPSVEEFHEGEPSMWSPQAPIALNFHPYNRCEVWQCRRCQKPYLRYTEYGGYYEEQRIRELRPELVTLVTLVTLVRR